MEKNIILIFRSINGDRSKGTLMQNVSDAQKNYTQCKKNFALFLKEIFLFLLELVRINNCKLLSFYL